MLEPAQTNVAGLDDGLTYDRRQSPRYASAYDEFVIEFRGCRFQARVLDAAMGGLGLWIQDAGTLAAGCPVQVTGADGPARAVVRHLDALASGGYRVGVCWVDDAEKADP